MKGRPGGLLQECSTALPKGGRAAAEPKGPQVCLAGQSDEVQSKREAAPHKELGGGPARVIHPTMQSSWDTHVNRTSPPPPGLPRELACGLLLCLGSPPEHLLEASNSRPQVV